LGLDKQKNLWYNKKKAWKFLLSCLQLFESYQRLTDIQNSSEQYSLHICFFEWRVQKFGRTKETQRELRRKKQTAAPQKGDEYTGNPTAIGWRGDRATPSQLY
jgi:hypothetical protein